MMTLSTRMKGVTTDNADLIKTAMWSNKVVWPMQTFQFCEAGLLAGKVTVPSQEGMGCLLQKCNVSNWLY